MTAAPRRLATLGLALLLPACAAPGPVPDRLTAEHYRVALVGPDGFTKGPFADLATCHAVRMSYVLTAGWDGDWSTYRCV